MNSFSFLFRLVLSVQARSEAKWNLIVFDEYGKDFISRKAKVRFSARALAVFVKGSKIEVWLWSFDEDGIL